jgi:hypothetical protein
MDRLEEIQEREQKVTGGEWHISNDPSYPGIYTQLFYDGETRKVYICLETEANDAEFIAYARSDIPWLLDQLAQARQEASRQSALVEYLMLEFYILIPSAL